MRVQSVIKVNTQQQSKPNTMQNSGSAVKSASGAAFEDCLKSQYQHRDPQKDENQNEYKNEATTPEIILTSNMIYETEVSLIDIMS